MTGVTEQTRPRASVLRRVIVGVIIVSFGLAALGGIVVLLGAELGDPAWKVLGTTALVGAFSVAVLCCASLLGKRLQVIGLVGAVVALIAAVLSIIALWSQPSWEAELFWDVLWTTVAASVGLSFACLLLLLADRRQRVVRIGLIVTLALFALVFVLVVYPVWTDDAGGEAYSRTLGIASILAALGAIVVPVLSLLLRGRPDDAAPRPDALSPSTIARLEAEAARRGVTPDELVAELIWPATPPA
ncbi:hypothetical protein [Microbacterium sp. SSM24]|uniref:hypothetical protein n=1 Tax=Microbacterium sp. SSM24 TaxID=2991714 RepID=UPI0022272716|nr:hypothetical protein [Microbacterium sp. SSM24]MCW3493972.1 hypothetical protein [Microbacterium sp. SSM24]